MGRISEERVLTLERKTADLQARLTALEGRVADPAAAAWPAPRSAPLPTAAPAPAPAPAPVAPAPRREPLDLEELLGGRVLAWTGGVAVLAGIAFLLAIAVSRGWIGPTGRTLVAGTLSVALIAAGAWLYEHRRRTDAALATLSAGIAGLFTTVAVGGPVYGVLPAMAALLLALATGALATTFAVRWASRGIGALGIVGALLAPVLAGAPSTATTLALLWLAAASGAAVLVWQRWNWLALAVYALPLAQWAWWIGDARPDAPAIVLVLALFGAVNAAAAIGFELRVPAARLRAASALLLTANATTLALAGWYALDEAGATTAGRLWIGALAAAHIGVGLATRATRINRDVRMLALLLGVVLADVTAGLMLEGVVLAAAFAVTTAGFAWLARRVLRAGQAATEDRDELLLGLGLGGHLLLTTIQALTQAPPDALSSGDAFAFGGYAAIAATACAAFVAGRFVDEVRHEWRVALDVVALTGAAYLTAAALDGPLLAGAYAAEAAALGAIALRGRDAVAAWGGAAYLALALGHALVFEATPDSLVHGVDDLAGAALALGAAAAAGLWGMHLLGPAGSAERDAMDAPDATTAPSLPTQARAALAATAAITLLYLASVAVVTTSGPGDSAQLLLSGLWAISGLAALVTGLRRDDRPLRLGSLALLLVTIGKVFLYDLSALTSLYRVGSFIGLGLLLLVAAGIWQRMRPPALPDLREVPPAVR
ncbi:MAG: hypothetical protein QOI64_1070 [Solirubrobacteraceae bacterium]|nr:hypothetical protein [Solirubrobacteraceae bacterium]